MCDGGKGGGRAQVTVEQFSFQKVKISFIHSMYQKSYVKYLIKTVIQKSFFFFVLYRVTWLRIHGYQKL